MEGYTTFMNWKAQDYKDDNVPKLIHIFSANKSKLPAALCECVFGGYLQADPKVQVGMQSAQHGQNNLKEE